MTKTTLKPKTEREFDKLFKRMRDGGLGGKCDSNGNLIWDVDSGDDDEASYSNVSNSLKRFIAKVEQRAIERERERINKILDSFLIEDEFYGKGMAEQMTEVIIEAIKIQLTPPTTNERKE